VLTYLTNVWFIKTHVKDCVATNVNSPEHLKNMESGVPGIS